MRLPKLLTVDQAADLIGVATSTIDAWINSGFLPSRRRMTGHGYLVTEEELNRCARAPRDRKVRRVPLRPWHVKAKAERDKKRASVAKYTSHETSPGE
jgi:excisionase family DNA binding protein